MTSQAAVRDTAELIELTLLQRNVEKTLGNSLNAQQHMSLNIFELLQSMCFV